MKQPTVAQQQSARPLMSMTLRAPKKPLTQLAGGTVVVSGGAARRRIAVQRTVAGFAAATLLLAFGAGAYAAAASGNAKAVAFYGESRTAMARYAGITFEGTGVSYKTIPEQGYDNFRFDFGTTPAGYKPAVDHVQVVQTDGRVVEEIDTLTAPGLPALRLWQQWQHGPISEIGEVMTATPCAEFIPTNSASYVTLGGSFVVDSGFQFARLKNDSSGNVIVRSTWSLSGSTVHETDTIAANTQLWVRSHIALKGGPNNGDKLAEGDFHYSTGQPYEQAPQVGKC